VRKRVLSLGTTLILSFLFTNCGGGGNSGTTGGGGGGGTPPTTTPSISSDLHSLTLSGADSTTVGITVANDGAGQVQLSVSGVPSGVTAVLGAQTLSAGESTGLLVSVDPSAAAGSANLTVKATRGSSSGTTSIGLTISQPAAQSLPLPIYVPGSGGIKSMTYDKVHRLGFAVDPQKNRIAVISPDSGRIIRSINIANPTAIDACPNGSRVYATTQTDGYTLVAIDPIKLEVVETYSWNPTAYRPASHAEVVCTSTGSVMLVVNGLIGVLKSGTFHQLTPTPSYASDFRLTPSADHAYIYMYGQYGVQLYDAAGDSLGAPLSTQYIGSINANPQKPELAVTFYSAGLKIMTLDWAELAEGQLGAPYGYSADGTKLLFGSSYPPDDIVAYSATDLSRLGLLSSTNNPKIGPAQLVAIDQKLMFLVSGDGIRIFDSSEMGPTPTNPGGPAITAFDKQVVPAGRQSQVLLSGNTPTVENVWISNVQAATGTPSCSAGSCITNVTIPATVTPGLATATVHYGGGWKTVVTNQFSVGPDFEEIRPHGGTPKNAASVEGWGTPFLPSEGDLYFGGMIARHRTVNFEIPDYPTTGTVSVTVVTPNGTATKPNTFTFIRESLTPLQGAISDVLLDPSRNVIYLSNYDNNRVDVFSTSSKQILNSIPVGKNPRGVALSADGSKLFVANLGDSSISIVDPDGKTATTTVNLHPLLPFYPAILPDTVAPIDSNRAFVAEGESRTYIVDLSTGNTTAVSMPPPGPRLGDTGKITTQGGCLWTIATADLQCKRGSNGLVDVTPDGSRILSGFDLLDADLNYLSVMIAERYLTHSEYFWYGNTKLHATGGLIYWAYTNGAVMLNDAITGERLTELSTVHSVDVNVNSIKEPIHNLTTDLSGKNIYLLTTDGLVVFTIDQLPLSTGIITPSSGGQGTLITIKGTGFQNGIKAAFGTTAVTTTWIDENTIQIVAPGSSAGSRLKLTNPNGDTYVREFVFSYSQ
jgi:YVTN family beta-propeller protein